MNILLILMFQTRNIMEIISQLKKTKRQTLELFDMSEENLNRSYAEGKWTNREMLNHLADAESVLYDRIRRAISEPRQVIWSFDQDAWANGLNYEEFPLDINKRLYAAARDGVIYLAQQHYEVLGEKEFVHSESGIKTLKDEFDKVAWHNAHHLEQVRATLIPR